MRQRIKLKCSCYMRHPISARMWKCLAGVKHPRGASLSSKRVRAAELERSLKVTDATPKVDTKSDNSISTRSTTSQADGARLSFLIVTPWEGKIVSLSRVPCYLLMDARAAHCNNVPGRFDVTQHPPEGWGTLIVRYYRTLLLRVHCENSWVCHIRPLWGKFSSKKKK